MGRTARTQHKQSGVRGGEEGGWGGALLWSKALSAAFAVHLIPAGGEGKGDGSEWEFKNLRGDSLRALEAAEGGREGGKEASPERGKCRSRKKCSCGEAKKAEACEEMRTSFGGGGWAASRAACAAASSRSRFSGRGSREDEVAGSWRKEQRHTSTETSGPNLGRGAHSERYQKYTTQETHQRRGRGCAIQRSITLPTSPSLIPSPIPTLLATLPRRPRSARASASASSARSSSS